MKSFLTKSLQEDHQGVILGSEGRTSRQHTGVHAREECSTKKKTDERCQRQDLADCSPDSATVKRKKKDQRKKLGANAIF